MRRGLFRSLGALVASAAAAVAFATPAVAQQPGVAVHLADSGTRAADYWTADRMRAATPLDTVLAAPGQVLGDVARGLPELVPPVDAQAARATGEPWTGGGEVTETAGRVFFTFGGNPASCSGNAVTSGNRSVVITAGHCVKYQGSWHTDWIFVPGYHDGQAPYGEWTASQTLTTPQWEASEDLNYDVGAAVVEPLDGAYLTDVVGGAGHRLQRAPQPAHVRVRLPGGRPLRRP